MSLSTQPISITSFSPSGITQQSDYLAAEEPLEIRLGFGSHTSRHKQSLSITMRTPGDDVELALGFLFTEGIIRSFGDVISAAPCGPMSKPSLQNVVRVELHESAPVDLEKVQRNFYTTSSCGVCGKSSLAALEQKSAYSPFKPTWGPRIQAHQLLSLPEKLRERQTVFERTGGLHAAALFDFRGELVLHREDVGRHNALDKVIGSSLVDFELPLRDFGVLLSGRASFELIQKCMMSGCAFVAAVGAPSSLAVELAQSVGMTLVGFLKQDRFNIYCEKSRVIFN